jgi:hypothetical protein
VLRMTIVERARWNVSLSNIEKFGLALAIEPWRLLLQPSQGQAAQTSGHG